jgi:RpiB/LacA/LacB family sugar-phosphate isomerase
MMRIAIGADHRGFELKKYVAAFVKERGHKVLDLGTCSRRPVDYPDYAEAVGMSILEAKADRGILICGSGVGAAVAANKMPGIRACMCHDTYSAHQGVEHDDMNVLVLGSLVVSQKLAEELISAFLGARFDHEARHIRRLEKVLALENRAWFELKGAA